MPQFIVPQFIDVEDKIIGPITTRQFAMGVVAVLLVFASYKFADTALFAVQTAFILGIYILIGFVKINGQRFYLFILSVIRSLLRANLRVWSKISIPNPKKISKDKDSEQDAKTEVIIKPHPKSGALSSLSLLVDTGGKYKPEEVLRNKKEASLH